MVSSLSGDTLQKAIKELNEVPERRMEHIRELRARLEAWVPDPEDSIEQGLKLSRIDEDKFLLCFLRARKFDLDRTIELFVNYHKFRAKHSHLLGEISVQAAESTLKANIVSVLPVRTLEGSKVLVARLSYIDFEANPLEMVMKMMLVILDKLIEEEDTQVHGIVICEDMQGMTFLQMMGFARKEVLSKGIMLDLLQDGFPSRFKGFHILNQPWYISFFLRILQPFMKQKTRDRMHMHGADYSSLHAILPADRLPLEFGGELDSLDSYSALYLFSEPLNESR